MFKRELEKVKETNSNISRDQEVDQTIELGQSRIQRRKHSIFSGDADVLEGLIKELNQTEGTPTEQPAEETKDRL